MINTKLQSIIDTKSAIGNAIVNKGGTITSETPFFNYAAQIDGISTGTPQTIFQASDGSKWARTNVVNLTNVSNNVTSDFNRWQPANNSTSDPILNVGTVGANISGNIRIVQVNQVNISQYVNLVAQDNNGAKYEGFNGYDSQTNPTPTGNTTFNRWLLNNSATGTVLFANATFTTGTYNGPNNVESANISNMTFINNTAGYGGEIRSITTNNGFIYVGGFSNLHIQKFYESNLGFLASVDYQDLIFSIVTNNGFIYVGGSDQRVKKYRESNLALVGNTPFYGGTILTVTTNNGFIYVGGGTNQTVQKFGESNLTRVGNTATFGQDIRSITTNDGFIYAGGDGVNGVSKYYESNLVKVGNTAHYGGNIQTITTNNGFIYVGGGDQFGSEQRVKKYGESNLSLVSNTVSYGGNVHSVTTNNGFIYVGGTITNTVRKYYESNLVFVANTASYGGNIFSVTTNDGFIYAGGATNQRVQKFSEQSTESIPETLTFYTATKIKE
jgi:hypothetical protein